MSDFSLPSFNIPSSVQNGQIIVGAPQDNLVVTFYRHSVHSQALSDKEGRPVFVEKDYVKILVPGERDTVDRPVRDEDKFRWARQWQAYHEKRQQAPEGTPIDCLFPQAPAIVATLRAMNFHVVEQLATASDIALQNIGMGARQWQEKAKQFLAAAKDGAAFHQMQGELRARDEKIAEMDGLIQAQAAKLAQLEAAAQGTATPAAVDINAIVAAAVAQAMAAHPDASETSRKRGRPAKEAA
jgi:hypothetical protein